MEPNYVKENSHQDRNEKETGMRKRHNTDQRQELRNPEDLQA
jgi:hypothetical protein